MKNTRNRIVKKFIKSRSRALNKYPKKVTGSHLGKVNKKINQIKRFSKIKRKNKPNHKFRGVETAEVARVTITKIHPDSDYKISSPKSRRGDNIKYNNMQKNHINQKLITRKKSFTLDNKIFDKLKKISGNQNNTNQYINKKMYKNNEVHITHKAFIYEGASKISRIDKFNKVYSKTKLKHNKSILFKQINKLWNKLENSNWKIQEQLKVAGWICRGVKNIDGGKKGIICSKGNI